MAMDLEQAFGSVVDSVATQLQPLGFKRRGKAMRIVAGDNCGIVDFQRSTKSSHESISFTINIGVVCGELLANGPHGLKTAQIGDAHIRKRIDSLMPGRPDKWWEINRATDVAELELEVAAAVLSLAAPYIQRLLESTAIIALWESGQSPGLTDVRRSELLSTLKTKHNGGAV